MFSRKIISSILSVVSLLLFFQGCTTDSSDAPVYSGEELGFEPSPLAFPGSDGVTTTLSISDFKVTATYQDQYSVATLMDDVIVRRTGANKWVYSPTLQWPGPPVNFYMINPVSTQWSVRKWDKGAEIWSYHNDGKTDLIVATDYQALQTTSTLKVNFRHALSFVKATISTDIPEDYDVRIKFAYLSGVGTVGHYVFPTVSTNQQNVFDPESDSETGSWDSVGLISHYDYSYTIFGQNTPDNSGTSIPTGINSQFPLEGTGVQFMIPHKLQDSWSESWGGWNGDNIIIVYRIIRKSDGAIIWPNDSTPKENMHPDNVSRKWAVAPYHLSEASTDKSWLPGMAYIYRLTLHIPEQLSSSISKTNKKSTHPLSRTEAEPSSNISVDVHYY